MNRTRKVVLGLAAGVALLAGGTAAAAPALAGTDPPDPPGPDTGTVECPYDCDQVRERMHDQLRDRQQTGPPAGPAATNGRMHRHGHGPGDGTCRLAPDGGGQD